MGRLSLSVGLSLVCLLCSISLRAETQICPEAKDLPQFTLNVLENADFSLYDPWQITYDGVPMSDMQMTLFSKDDSVYEKVHKDMRNRGREVFFGMVTGALGTAVSSMGWVLYGQDQVSSTLSLSMALSGIVMSLAGTIFVSESIQVPLQPYLAPTPKHRFTRDEAREMVVRANKRLNQTICAASQKSSGEGSQEPVPERVRDAQ